MLGGVALVLGIAIAQESFVFMGVTRFTRRRNGKRIWAVPFHPLAVKGTSFEKSPSLGQFQFASCSVQASQVWSGEWTLKSVHSGGLGGRYPLKYKLRERNQHKQRLLLWCPPMETHHDPPRSPCSCSP